MPTIKPCTEEQLNKLTDTENTVLLYFCDGFTPAEIGKKLGNARESIHTRMFNIRKKLGVKKNHEVVISYYKFQQMED